MKRRAVGGEIREKALEDVEQNVIWHILIK
jgi:hypothetical protein